MSNPDVAREFNELKAATNERAAYAIWSLNNGNGIDKAPNGAESKLFNDLLEHYGDRTEAIRAKAKTYSKSFRDWFGDWIGEDKENVSKVVDNNGEPLVVWHASKNVFDIFDRSKVGSGLGLMDEDPKGFYFSEENIVKNDRYKIVYPVYINI
jgi:hypothetical protein